MHCPKDNVKVSDVWKKNTSMSLKIIPNYRSERL